MFTILVKKGIYKKGINIKIMRQKDRERESKRERERERGSSLDENHSLYILLLQQKNQMI